MNPLVPNFSPWSPERLSSIRSARIATLASHIEAAQKKRSTTRKKGATSRRKKKVQLTPKARAALDSLDPETRAALLATIEGT